MPLLTTFPHGTLRSHQGGEGATSQWGQRGQNLPRRGVVRTASLQRVWRGGGVLPPSHGPAPGTLGEGASPSGHDGAFSSFGDEGQEQVTADRSCTGGDPSGVLVRCGHGPPAAPDSRRLRPIERFPHHPFRPRCGAALHVRSGWPGISSRTLHRFSATDQQVRRDGKVTPFTQLNPRGAFGEVSSSVQVPLVPHYLL
ncbi:hypothetical protein SAMN00790413_06419 [Deinococcus hopiensis KR-140]|uniref:Uncharacterized protein n=1 Tax=Deinococcus hopiensis KR-140 TaxID=695939 RepID=A0A1W1VV33_9DEIO|nr:hypothetical protein SAMN00790413_06419 [Deinococcus hopiensis KR-140]